VGTGRKAQSRHLRPHQPVHNVHACNSHQDWVAQAPLLSEASLTFLRWGRGPLSPPHWPSLLPSPLSGVLVLG
jgi:hypothetical protein